MQLYQSRGFNEFFSDSFDFIKLHGKHFFKHFFTITGALLIVLSIVSYYFTKVYAEAVVSGITNGSNPFKVLDNFMNENFGIFILSIIVIIVVSLFFGLIIYSFTPIYFKLYEERGGANFEMADIIKRYKAQSGKLLSFLGYGILLAIPLGIAFFISAFILTITIIGILAIPMVVALFTSLYHMTLLEQLDNKRSFWDSFGYAWTLITSKFWHVVGALGILYLISYVVQLGVNLIQSIFQTASVLTDVTPQSVLEPQSLATTIIALLLFFITFLVSTSLATFIQVCQSIVYFSLKEEKENINTVSEIDQIGSSEA